MATKRTHNQEQVKNPTRRFLFGVSIAIVIVAACILGYFQHQVNMLGEFKDEQANAISLLENECGGIESNSFKSGFNKSNCLSAIDNAEAVGVIGQYCGYDSISIKKAASQSDAAPLRDNNCTDIASKITSTEKSIADQKEWEQAEDDIFYSCNSLAKMRGAGCANAKARYGHKWTYISCGKYGYVVPLSQIYGGAWHYTTFGGVDPHAGESCFWVEDR